METIGTMHDCTKEFEWKIADFFSIPEEPNKYYRSPSFLFTGEYWHLLIYPNGDDSVGYVSVYLWKELRGPGKKVTFSFSLKTSEGTKTNNVSDSKFFVMYGGFGKRMFCQRSTLLERKSELVPSNTLTILFSIGICKRATDDADNFELLKCSYCKEDFCLSYLYTHEQKCFSKPVKCPKCKEKIDVRKCFDHDCQREKMKGTEKLVDDLINTYRNGEYSDVTINVKGEEFQLHRCILANRNAFFNTMFKTEMKEKITGIVTIDDCKPDVFRSFIHFVYTGKVDEVSLENVHDLYEVANMYQEDQLKSECLSFMKSKISVDTFCDFIVVAFRHDEKDLLQIATDFFCRNIKEIIQTIKWQSFMREYPTQANELNIKAVDYFTSSK